MHFFRQSSSRFIRRAASKAALSTIIAAAWVCLHGGCSGGSSSASSSGGAVCVRGTQQACACLGGGEGVQVCNELGTGFEACTGCAVSSSSSSGSGTSASTSSSGSSSHSGSTSDTVRSSSEATSSTTGGQSSSVISESSSEAASSSQQGSSTSLQGSSSSTTPLAPSLVGVWRSPCLGPSGGLYGSTVWQFAPATAELSIIGTQDQACALSMEVSTVSYTYQTRMQVAGLQDTWEVDFVRGASRVRYTTAARVANANMYAAYGFTDWALNVEKDVSGRRYQPQSNPVSMPGTQSYSIYAVRGTTLFMGDFATGDGLTPQTRPAALRTTLPYERQ